MKPVRIVVVSDNHGRKDWIGYIAEHHPDADYKVHCGDLCMSTEYVADYIAVQGNNDYYGALPVEVILEVPGHRILIEHGHTDIGFGRYRRLALKAKKNDCDIVLFGHTHMYNDTVEEGVRLLNPGSIWRNRDLSSPSYMIVEIDGENVTVRKMEYIQFAG